MMGNSKIPLISKPSYCFGDYGDIVTRIQNLDLNNGVWDNNNQATCSSNHHPALAFSPHSSFPDQNQILNWSNNNIQGAEFLHQNSWTSHNLCNRGETPLPHLPSMVGNFLGTNSFADYKQLRTNTLPGRSWMWNVANQVPGIRNASDTAPAYNKTYMDGCVNPNRYYNQGFTERMSNGMSSGSLGSSISPQDIVLMATVKEGSMLLQHFLLERDQEIKKIILVGVLDHIPQLIIDPYGHHMIDKLVESCGENELRQILENLVSQSELLLRAAFDKDGSNSLQKLIKRLKKSSLGSLLTSILAPRVVDLATNKTARHVFRECLNLLSLQANTFLYEEAIRNFQTLARDEVGCLALNDCIDFATNSSERDKLVELVIDNAVSLAYDPYGNYVVQNAVKIPEYSVRICDKLKGHYLNLSTKKSGSHVVERCMESCSLAVTHAIVEILEKKKALELARNEYGNYVIQTALTQSSQFQLQLRESLVDALLPGLCDPMQSRTSKKLAKKIIDLAIRV